MKKKKILTSLLGIGLLSIALASCTGKKKTSTSTQTEESNTNPITDTTPVESNTTTEKTNDKVLEHITKKDATCSEDGNIEYWYEPITGKYYMDKDGYNEISLSDTIISKGHNYTLNPYGPNFDIIECDKCYDKIIHYTNSCTDYYYSAKIKTLPTLTEKGEFTISEGTYNNNEFTVTSTTSAQIPELSNGDAYIVYRASNRFVIRTKYILDSANKYITDSTDLDTFINLISDLNAIETNDVDSIISNSTYSINLYSENTIVKTIKATGKDGFKLDVDVLEKEHYKLIGFSKTLDGEIDYQLNEKYNIDETLNLYAIWESSEFKLEFDLNGATGSIDPMTTDYGYVTIPDVSSIVSSNQNKIFKGFSFSKDGSTDFFYSGDSFKITESKVIYAIWEDRYTVTYNMNGYGDETIVQAASDSNNVTVKPLKDLPITLPAGKGAIGYSLDPNATTATYNFNNTYNLKENITLYVIYKDLTAVTFDFNGSGDASQTVYASTSGYVTTPNEPTRTGYVFLGWSTDKNALSGAAANKSIYVSQSGSVTYYALWTDRPILSYDFNNTTTSATLTPIAADADGKVTINSWKDNLTYYKFLGWSFDKDATEPSFMPGETITITSNKTIYAIWEKTATYNFYPNGGEGKYKNYSMLSLDSTLEIHFTFERRNYIFLGWAASASSTEIIYPADTTTFTIKEKDLGKSTNLYAVWKGKDVSFNLVNGTDITDTLSSFSNETAYGNKITLPDASYFNLSSEYKFLGWSTCSYSFGDSIPSIDFSGGIEMPVDDFMDYAENGTINLHAIIIETKYTYTTTVVEPTLEYDGYIDYTCIEDVSKSYREVISNKSLFYAYVEDVFAITGRGTVIQTTIQQGTINVGDVITLVLKDGTIKNNVIIQGIDKNKQVVNSAKAGDIVGLLVDVDKNDIALGCFMCEKDKQIHTNTIYVNAHILTKDEGGRHSPFFINYAPQISIGNTTYACKVTALYDVYGKTTDMILPGTDCMLKIEVPSGANYSFYTWVGQKHTLIEGGRTVANIEVVGRYEAQYNEYMSYCNVRIDLQDGNDLIYYHVASDSLVKDLPKPVREGYTFIGWGDQDELYDDIELYELVNTDEVINYSTRFPYSRLYAHWVKNDEFVVSGSYIIPSRGVTATTEHLGKDIAVGDNVIIVTKDGLLQTIITGIEYNKKSDYKELEAGCDNVTVLLRGLDKKLDIGDVLVIL